MAPEDESGESGAWEARFSYMFLFSPASGRILLTEVLGVSHHLFICISWIALRPSLPPCRREVGRNGPRTSDGKVFRRSLRQPLGRIELLRTNHSEIRIQIRARL